MHYRARILNIKHCGCDAEGEVQAQIENGATLWFYYQGSDAQAAGRFCVGKSISVELVGRLSNVAASDVESRSISFTATDCKYHASGRITSVEEVDGETVYLLDALFPLRIYPECPQTSLLPGMWVNVDGEIWAENWWD